MENSNWWRSKQRYHTDGRR